MDVILSIKPKYATQILNGTKKYELRRKVFNKDVELAYIYASHPTKKLVGSFKVGRILNGTPNKVWSECKKDAGIEKEEFLSYFYGSNEAFAIEVRDVRRFRPYINKLPNNLKPPQNFRYLEAGWLWKFLLFVRQAKIAETSE